MKKTWNGISYDNEIPVSDQEELYNALENMDAAELRLTIAENPDSYIALCAAVALVDMEDVSLLEDLNDTEMRYVLQAFSDTGRKVPEIIWKQVDEIRRLTGFSYNRTPTATILKTGNVYHVIADRNYVVATVFSSDYRSDVDKFCKFHGLTVTGYYVDD